MKARAPRILVPGTAPRGRGGVAAVLRTGGLFEQARVRYASTHSCQTIFHLHGGVFRQFATVRNSALMRRPIRHTLERSAGLRERLGERARAWAAQHYSMQAVCDRLAGIYNELAGVR